jgi:hypothetical protein
MPKKKAYVRLTEQGKVMPGSMIVSKSNGVPKNGPYKEIITNLCCGDTPFSVTSTKQKAWVCYDGNGEIIPGSLVVGPTYPQDRRNWREVKTGSGFSNPGKISIGNLSGTADAFFISAGGNLIAFVGQIFILPNNCNLNNIIIRVNKNGNPVFNIQYVIYKVVNGVPTDIVMGTSNKVSSSSLLSSTGGTAQFDFSNLYLPAGEYLFISEYVDVVTHNENNGLTFDLITPSVYSGGSTGYTYTPNSGSTITLFSDYDLISEINYLS